MLLEMSSLYDEGQLILLVVRLMVVVTVTLCPFDLLRGILLGFLTPSSTSPHQGC